MEKLIFEKRRIYGRIWFYPLCAHAQTLTSLLKSRVLNENQINEFTSLGLKFEIFTDDSPKRDKTKRAE